MTLPGVGRTGVFAAVFALVFGAVGPVAAEVTLFKQSVAEAAYETPAIGAFYRETGYQPIWTGPDADDAARRQALIRALSDAGSHGLPEGRYDIDALKAMLANVRGDRALGQVEVEMSRLFLAYARDVQTGILTPSEVDAGLVRDVPLRDGTALLRRLASEPARQVMDSLPPQTPEYARLMKEKHRLERQLARGGWGQTVRSRKLEPGDTGPEVIALRNRLIAMGYLDRSATASFDARLMAAVEAFQADHGLTADGVAGAGTIAEVNRSADTRLGQVLVAMERERWINQDLGARHIWVNLTDFHVRIVDEAKTSFVTRSVIGMDDPDRRSPEFSDVMEHMIINPTWHVPRSIATKEYLPRLQQNPYAVGHLTLVDRRGRVVPRDAVDFTQFSARSFPFNIKQRPSRSNALGLVKFMFPNRYNIYLHDTPAKDLFAREQRDFSHGCIRLHKPFEFAYALLAVQSDDPRGLFQTTLATGRETQIDLEKPVPVHIVYRTAFTQAKGRMQYRRDIYGRDAKIRAALEREGVTVGGFQS
ncbi:MAG: L,D-transpeptidase family protein [Pseudomonadota bacterium]